VIRESATYAITSLSRTRANAGFLLTHLRSHWHFENRGFHVLDLSLGDDTNRIRTGQAARVLNTIRNLTLNLARRLDQSNPNFC
jgi:predicted transposase YbfD/YdcC